LFRAPPVNETGRPELTAAPLHAKLVAMAIASARRTGAIEPSGPAHAATPSEPHVQFQDIGKSYDGRTMVVRDLNLDVRTGEFLTLLGPSGSGKTTCLMMLAGFEEPSSGTIRIGGRPVHDLPPRQRNIGVVFQNYALFPHLSVGANLSFPLEVRRMDAPQRRERVRRALSLVRLEGYEDRRPEQLSGGQQQRVAIARALVFEPQLVLMDEPLGALDRNLREEMQYEIRRIHRRLGVTIVYVTHDQQEAMVMSDRIAVFHRGRIEQVAPPEILYEEPERPFVARFIGGNNLVSGSVTAVDGDYCRVDVAGREVVAYRVADCAPGDQVTVAIRPERIGIARSGAAYRNQFPARVEMITFLGDHLVVHVSVDQHTEYLLRIPNIVGHGAMLEGDEITIGWAAADCRALADHHE
jgi:putative spermidine/putrescine transport system ATP-binding protein